MQSGAKTQSLCLKGRCGTIVATGEVVPGDILHGCPVGENNLKVMIKEVIQRNATTWFPDKFGDEKLQKGSFVAWPKQNLTLPENFSPIHARVRTKKSK